MLDEQVSRPHTGHMAKTKTDIDLTGIRSDLDFAGPQWSQQKAYPNGIVVWTRSTWGGNGFGTDVTKVAVRRTSDGFVIVGVYDSGRTHIVSRVAGVPDGDLTPDFCWTRNHKGERERRTTTTRLTKFIRAVKAL